MGVSSESWDKMEGFLWKGKQMKEPVLVGTELYQKRGGHRFELCLRCVSEGGTHS